MRKRIKISGLVQGVGFRPHVFLQAKNFNIKGFVFNDGEGVTIEAACEASLENNESRNIDLFINAIREKTPPLSRIDEIVVESISEASPQEKEFSIVTSQKSTVSTGIGPDSAVCDACLKELLTPGHRYHGYPFLNCTHCGPRYTIVRELPYDRPSTSMAEFPMCDSCNKEYHDPENRRFHAQPTACPKCGPKLSASIPHIVKQLKSGKILAIKGLGGFHLVCDAYNERTVSLLRERKHREAKPFAVMVANLSSLQYVIDQDVLRGDAGKRISSLLTSKERPIVLLPKKKDRASNHNQAARQLAPNIASGLQLIGVMLPYTPIHHLLFWEAAGHPSLQDYEKPLDFVLIMTSANLSDEPLVIGNKEAQERLSDIADEIITHDRNILIRVDDSVMSFVNNAPLMIRRARGYTPDPIKFRKIPHHQDHKNNAPVTLCFGSDLKNTICITRKGEAFLSQHIGDLEKSKNQDFCEQIIEHLLKLLAVRPEMIACDAHPDFFSTLLARKWATTLNISEDKIIPVQHHHAHVGAVMAEHGLNEPVLGLTLDGFGLSLEGDLWGGELLLVDGVSFKRLGHLKTIPEPGGDQASKEPWRMATALLHSLGLSDEAERRFGKLNHFNTVWQMLEKDANCPKTSSLGRLFDAAAGLLGASFYSRYEAEGPMLLEGFVTKPEVLRGGWDINSNTSGNESVINFAPLIKKLLTTDLLQGANLFHGTIASGLSSLAYEASKKTGIKKIILSGGCILNKVLTESLIKELESLGLKPVIPSKVPPSDGSISLGQAWVIQG